MAETYDMKKAGWAGDRAQITFGRPSDFDAAVIEAVESLGLQ
jgi:hypothetical protein